MLSRVKATLPDTTDTKANSVLFLPDAPEYARRSFLLDQVTGRFYPCMYTADEWVGLDLSFSIFRWAKVALKSGSVLRSILLYTKWFLHYDRLWDMKFLADMMHKEVIQCRKEEVNEEFWLVTKQREKHTNTTSGMVQNLVLSWRFEHNFFLEKNNVSVCDTAAPSPLSHRLK